MSKRGVEVVLSEADMAMVLAAATASFRRSQFLTKASDQMPVEEWLAIRKQAGKQIDPATAEVTWRFAYTPDPYGVYHDLTPEERQVGRCYFARAPGSDVWVEFGDLPEETLKILRAREKRGDFDDDDYSFLFGAEHGQD